MNGKSISFGQATERLLSGGELSWLASSAARSGSITLAEPGQRRLFSYLLGADAQDVAEGSDTLFDNLTTTWRDEDSDPIPDVSDTGPDANDGPWRLHGIETTNFGGLNTYGGPVFALELGGEDWCLEGSNGSGRAIVKSCVWADHAAARSWRSPSTNLTPRMISARWFDPSSFLHFL